jgi:hypothetical protein
MGPVRDARNPLNQSYANVYSVLFLFHTFRAAHVMANLHISYAPRVYSVSYLCTYQVDDNNAINFIYG